MLTHWFLPEIFLYRALGPALPTLVNSHQLPLSRTSVKSCLRTPESFQIIQVPNMTKSTTRTSSPCLCGNHSAGTTGGRNTVSKNSEGLRSCRMHSAGTDGSRRSSSAAHTWPLSSSHLSERSLNRFGGKKHVCHRDCTKGLQNIVYSLSCIEKLSRYIHTKIDVLSKGITSFGMRRSPTDEFPSHVNLLRKRKTPQEAPGMIEQPLKDLTPPWSFLICGIQKAIL